MLEFNLTLLARNNAAQVLYSNQPGVGLPEKGGYTSVMFVV